MKNPRVTTREGVWYLAMIQVIVGILSLTCSLIALMLGSTEDFDVTDALVDVALGYWAMYGTEFCKLGPVDKFSFAQFILALKAAVLVPIAILFYSCGGGGIKDDTGSKVIFATVSGVYYVYSATYKLYYSYIAWSCCYEILSSPAGKDADRDNHVVARIDAGDSIADWLFGMKTDGTCAASGEITERTAAV